MWMTGRIAARLPWALLGLCLAIVATHLILLWLILREPAINILASSGIANMLAIPSFIPLVAVGALVAARHPRNSFGWLLLPDSGQQGVGDGSAPAAAPVEATSTKQQKQDDDDNDQCGSGHCSSNGSRKQTAEPL
jgi:hypothetical protein